MDLKNFILFFVLILTFRQTHGYIKCNEMANDTVVYTGSVCTLVDDINENYFFKTQFYSADSARMITKLNITANLSDIPDGIGVRFGAIQTLEFFHTGLENLRKKSLDKVPFTVTSLTMNHGKFKTLLPEMFTGVANLIDLILSNGTIKSIHDTAFAKLVKLRNLDLSNNRIRNLTKAMFDELPSLNYLKISDNLISGTLESGLFAGCPHLFHLNFADNQITTVMDGFVSTKYIHNLFFPRNRLTNLDLSSVQISFLTLDSNNLTELMINSAGQSLSASHNNISKLICSNDSNLTLVELRLAHNSISSMECIEKAPSLEHLDLSYNNIGKLNISSFANLSELKSLHLQHSNISNLVLGVFSHQSTLQVLDISYNQLRGVSFNVFVAAKYLKELRIEGNNLTNIPYWNMDQLFPSLKALGIRDNSFACSELAAIFMYFNKFKQDDIIITPPMNERIIYSPNIKGIECIITNSTPIPSDEFDFNAMYVSYKVLEHRFSNLEMTVNKQKIFRTLNEIDVVKAQMKILSWSEHLHFVILCVMVSIIGAIVVGGLGYYGYNKWKGPNQPRAPENMPLQEQESRL